MTDGASRVAWLALWAVACLLAAAWFAANIGATHVGNDWVPVSYDSFYHARRILDATGNLGAFYEFDTHIHAPQGSQVTWPWAYDYVLAAIATLATLWFPGLSPLALLAFVPPLLFALNAALLLRCAKALGLGLPAAAFALLAWALSPLTLFTHAPGNIDHHHAEQAFVLLALLAAVRWLDQPLSARRAVLAGVVLGFAHGAHNGLFVLQLPLLAALAVLWWSGRAPPPRATAAFGFALMASMLLVLLPSQPFQQGSSGFHLLSWFHLYAACATALAVGLFARVPATRGAIAGVALLGAALAAVQAVSVLRGLAFVQGEIAFLGDIVEAASFREIIAQRSLAAFLDSSSWLPFAFPAMLWGCWTLRSRPGAALALAAYLLLGFAMYSQQQRLFYYALPAMVLSLGAALEALPAWRTWRPAKRLVVAIVLALAAIAPTQRLLRTPLPPGGDDAYVLSRPVLLELARACEARPGIVLAHRSLGHFITFHTKCSVIADNFILTPQHIERIRRADALLAMAGDELRREEPGVTYLVLQAPGWAVAAAAAGEVPDAARETRPVARALLFGQAEQPGFVPLGMRVANVGANAKLVLVGLWAVLPPG